MIQSRKGEVRITTNEPAFSAYIKSFAAAALRDIDDEFRNQTRLLGVEMISRTPPFGGKALKRMAAARGLNLLADIEDLTAKKVGERRVELDLRKVIYGFNGAQMPEKTNPVVYKSQNAKPVQDWGVLQKCEGIPAVRIFATKTGEVYGVDLQRFMPNASTAELDAVHERNRGKRGRVTTAGQRDRVVGRWRWMDVVITSAKNLAEYIKLKKKSVGQAKGGWADGVLKLQGKVAGWVKHHVKAGRGVDNSTPGHFSFTFVNESRWASGGDTDRIIEKSIEGREEALKENIAHALEKRWGEGAGRSAVKELSV